jgi:dTDP-glucose 4,6-dehydratase
VNGVSGWTGRRVLVTGAAGFIGSHLAEHLARSGADVRAFVRYTSRNDYGWLESLPNDALDHIEVFRGDLENPEAVGEAVAGCETVFHLGALIPIPYSYRHPREFVASNVVGTLNVLEALRRADDAPRLVHTSSSEVYGTTSSPAIDENHPLRPQSPYAATKVAADQLVLSYHRSFGTRAVLARPFNTFGPRQSARAVLPTIITQALTADVVNLGAVSTTRDFVYVSDTVAGFVACGDAPGVEGEILNFGTGIEIPVAKVVELVLGLVGRDLPVVTDDERLRPAGSEVERLIADSTKAHRLLGWQPQTTFEDALDATVDWFRANLDVYKASIYNV